MDKLVKDGKWKDISKVLTHGIVNHKVLVDNSGMVKSVYDIDGFMKRYNIIGKSNLIIYMIECFHTFHKKNGTETHGHLKSPVFCEISEIGNVPQYSLYIFTCLPSFHQYLDANPKSELRLLDLKSTGFYDGQTDCRFNNDQTNGRFYDSQTDDKLDNGQSMPVSDNTEIKFPESCKNKVNIEFEQSSNIVYHCEIDMMRHVSSPIKKNTCKATEKVLEEIIMNDVNELKDLLFWKDLKNSDHQIKDAPSFDGLINNISAYSLDIIFNLFLEELCSEIYQQPTPLKCYSDSMWNDESAGDIDLLPNRSSDKIFLSLVTISLTFMGIICKIATMLNSAVISSLLQVIYGIDRRRMCSTICKSAADVHYFQAFDWPDFWSASGHTHGLDLRCIDAFKDGYDECKSTDCSRNDGNVDGQIDGELHDGHIDSGRHDGQTDGRHHDGKTEGGLYDCKSEGGLHGDQTESGFHDGKSEGGLHDGQTDGIIHDGKTEGGLHDGQNDDGLHDGKTDGELYDVQNEAIIHDCQNDCGLHDSQNDGGLHDGQIDGGRLDGQTVGGLNDGQVDGESHGGLYDGQTESGLNNGHTDGGDHYDSQKDVVNYYNGETDGTNNGVPNNGPTINTFDDGQTDDRLNNGWTDGKYNRQRNSGHKRCQCSSHIICLQVEHKSPTTGEALKYLPRLDNSVIEHDNCNAGGTEIMHFLQNQNTKRKNEFYGLCNQDKYSNDTKCQMEQNLFDLISGDSMEYIHLQSSVVLPFNQNLLNLNIEHPVTNNVYYFMQFEVFRLVSFNCSEFPSDLDVFVTNLAKSGFYYAQPEIICYGCENKFTGTIDSNLDNFHGPKCTRRASDVSLYQHENRENKEQLLQYFIRYGSLTPYLPEFPSRRYSVLYRNTGNSLQDISSSDVVQAKSNSIFHNELLPSPSELSDIIHDENDNNMYLFDNEKPPILKDVPHANGAEHLHEDSQILTSNSRIPVNWDFYGDKSSWQVNNTARNMVENENCIVSDLNFDHLNSSLKQDFSLTSGQITTMMVSVENAHQSDFTQADSLLMESEAVLGKEDSRVNASQVQQAARPGVAFDELFQAVERENTLLSQRSKCQICHTRSIGSIYLPCGHVISCQECADEAAHCSLCKKTIVGTANVYLA